MGAIGKTVPITSILFPFLILQDFFLFLSLRGNREAGKVHVRDKDNSIFRQEMFYALLLRLHLTSNSFKSPNFIVIEGASLLIEVFSLSWHGIFF